MDTASAAFLGDLTGCFIAVGLLSLILKSVFRRRLEIAMPATAVLSVALNYWGRDRFEAVPSVLYVLSAAAWWPIWRWDNARVARKKAKALPQP